MLGRLGGNPSKVLLKMPNLVEISSPIGHLCSKFNFRDVYTVMIVLYDFYCRPLHICF